MSKQKNKKEEEGRSNESCVYKSFFTSNRYFVVLAGSDVSSLPEKVKSKPEKTIDINSGENRIGFSAVEAINDINNNGYHMTDISIQFNENI